MVTSIRASGSRQVSRRTLLLGAASVAALAGPAQARAHAAGQHAAPGLRVAVVGSGYGGAVAALRLAQAGVTVELIEMGADWSAVPATEDGKVFTRMTKPSGRSVWLRTRTSLPYDTFLGVDPNASVERSTGVLGISELGATKVYRGVGVGGGSLVNGGMAVRPRLSFLRQQMPQLDVDDMEQRWLPLAERELGVVAPPQELIDSEWYRFARVGMDQAHAVGLSTTRVPNVYDWEHLLAETRGQAPASATAQEVIYGNNHGKKDLTKTYLARALATGRVSLRALTEVTGLRRREDGSYALDLLTRAFGGAEISRSTQAYDRVILAAGSVGTAEILQRARAEGGLSGLSPELGAGWGPNGNVMVARYLWGTATGTKQATIPVAGIDAWDDSTASVFAEIAPLPIGVESFTSSYLAITNNPERGRFGWDDTARRLTLDWGPDRMAGSLEAVKGVLDPLNRRFGSIYRTDLFAGGRPFADHFTYHPLGGAVLGRATDELGELHGAPGLFVLDGSLVPGALGVNPFVTITALAERCVAGLVAAGRFDAA